MAIKRTIYKFCQYCGKQQAKIMENGTIAVFHNCSRVVPGPQNPPKTYKLNEVIFVEDNLQAVESK